MLEDNSSVVFQLKMCHTHSLEFLISWKALALLYLCNKCVPLTLLSLNFDVMGIVIPFFLGREM